MMEAKQAVPRFFGYPKPIEAPTIPFTKSHDKNPVFSGALLVIGAWLFVYLAPLVIPADILQCL